MDAEGAVQLVRPADFQEPPQAQAGCAEGLSASIETGLGFHHGTSGIMTMVDSTPWRLLHPGKSDACWLLHDGGFNTTVAST